MIKINLIIVIIYSKIVFCSEKIDLNKKIENKPKSKKTTEKLPYKIIFGGFWVDCDFI